MLISSLRGIEAIKWICLDDISCDTIFSAKILMCKHHFTSMFYQCHEMWNISIKVFFQCWPPIQFKAFTTYSWHFKTHKKILLNSQQPVIKLVFGLAALASSIILTPLYFFINLRSACPIPYRQSLYNTLCNHFFGHKFNLVLNILLQLETFPIKSV